MKLSLCQRVCIRLIRLYQATLSPDHGPASGGFYGCRYYPSCSEYMARAIEKHGCLVGIAKGIWRIVRCNPFAKGGVDELK